MSIRKRKLSVACLRFLWFSRHPIIRPLFFANIAMILLPAHPIELPTAIGVGFSLDVFFRSIERIMGKI